MTNVEAENAPVMQSFESFESVFVRQSMTNEETENAPMMQLVWKVELFKHMSKYDFDYYD